MVKFNKYIVLLSILFLLQSCHSKRSEIFNKIFEVEDIGDKEIPFTFYEQEGFKLVYEDITIFEKKNKDTITLLYINDKLNTINKKIWKIKLNNTNQGYINNWITYYNTNVSLVPPILNENDVCKHFFAKNYINNTVFLCKVKQEHGTDYLFIEYHYPLKGKNLKKNMEFYNNDDEAKTQEETTKMLNVKE